MIEVTLKKAKIFPYLKKVFFNTDKNYVPKGFLFHSLEQSVKLDNKIIEKYAVYEKEFFTSIIRLDKDEEDLFYSMDKKSCRYEIKKALKEKHRIKIVENKNYDFFYNIGIEYFKHKYGNKYKKYIKTLLLKPHNLFKNNHKLFLIYYDDIFVAGHFYILDPKNKIARLTLSFSKYFYNDYFKKLSSYLNRYLHWHDILYFKDKGFLTYDFGGINLDRNSDTYGITKFKLSFGGEIVKQYNYLLVPKIYYSNKIFKKFLI